MCHFISFIEQKSEKTGKTKIYFLTGDKLFRTLKGEETRKHIETGFSGASDDYLGHGAIRFYYDLKAGTERECTDFSSPSNFPKQIVRALKRGEFRGFDVQPQGLLSAPAYKAYQEATAPADKAYQEATATAYKAYQEATAPAYKAYQEATATAFWDLWDNPANRAAAWK